MAKTYTAAQRAAGFGGKPKRKTGSKPTRKGSRRRSSRPMLTISKVLPAVNIGYSAYKAQQGKGNLAQRAEAIAAEVADQTIGTPMGLAGRQEGFNIKKPAVNVGLWFGGKLARKVANASGLNRLLRKATGKRGVVV